ncbi:pyridoxamine 5'-phosphate oxidase family protein [Antrihabitans cavernicola]|uniref:Pyridoxamine 5'-phosphate oxidase family protein n=2 Tax=Antrihabitans cavernicola TaxID=2495913 RepID=A0A5A7SIG2_9NOCA|nr:pyridoxamine 5'-phosphate oxidase family protein [Spelaeibacter cavernicola]
MHCAIASVGADGGPHVTPVGTVFLRDDRTGFYVDRYTSVLAHNVEADPRICLMAVDSGVRFWFRSLLVGRFSAPPGIRLYGTVGALRPATAAELDLVHKSVRTLQWMKGGRLLWSDLDHVRDITFTGFRPVRYPVMMSHLWQNVR